MVDDVFAWLRRRMSIGFGDRDDESESERTADSTSAETTDDLVVETATDVGQQREVNEDTPYEESLDSGYLVAVADGMGGHQAGDVASETAAETLVEELDASAGDAREQLDAAITAVNDAVNRKAAEAEDLSGMGTTLVAALVRDGEAVIGNVGDSRAYLIGEEIEQVTEDQSLVRGLVESGTVDEDEAEDHPQRHVLAQALGTDETVEPDFYERPLDGRALLLCSDGLTEEVPDEAIRGIVAAADSVADAAEALVDRANENGGSDNVSVVLARYGNG